MGAVLFPLAQQLGPLGAARGGGAAGPQSRYSLSFDGSGGVDVPSFPGPGAASVTYSCWVKFASVSGGGSTYQLVSKNAGFQLRLTPSGNFFHFFRDSSAAEVTASAFGAPVAGTWYFVAAWYDAGGTMNISVNGGVAQSAAASPQADNAASTLTLGYRGPEGTARLDGLLDDALVYPGVLTAPQLVALAAGTLNPATLTTSGLWRFEEGSGLTTADSSGNGNTGALTGGVTWSTDVPAALS